MTLFTFDGQVILSSSDRPPSSAGTIISWMILCKEHLLRHEVRQADIPSAGAGIQMTFSIKRSMGTVSMAEGVLIVFVVILGTALIGATIDWLVFPFPAKHISVFSIQALNLTKSLDLSFHLFGFALKLDSLAVGNRLYICEFRLMVAD
jgi:hypothetical protein